MPQGLLSRVGFNLNARSGGAGDPAAPAPRGSVVIRQSFEAAAGLARVLRTRIDNGLDGLKDSFRFVASRIAAADSLEPRLLLSATYFVATNGSNSNPGTIDAPFQTIQYAASIAGPGDTIDIRGGTYHESVKPANSGSPGAPITFQAYNGENVVIDGADPVTGWSNYNGSIYEADDSTDLGFGNNQVFVNGQAINEATWPNLGLNLSHPQLATVQSGGDALTDDALASSGVDWTGGVIHIISGQAWVAQTATITSDSGNRITFNLQGTQDPDGPIQPGDKYYLTGKLAGLQSPGQFFLGSGGSLYVWTPDSSDPNSDNVEVKDRLYGFNLSGKSYINVQGINLFACSILANGSNNVNINNITGEYVSQFVLDTDGWKTPTNTGIDLNGNDNSITNSVIAYSAGDGILALGYNNVIKNNIVHDCDYAADDCAGIRAVGGGDTIDNNTVYNCGRDGIKFSHCTDTEIEGNLIHDVMLQTTDGGGIYTYGTNGSGCDIAYNIVYNVHSGGWGSAGLYLDNDSSNYSVHNNSVSNVDIGLKLNPTSYSEKIVDNTLLADSQSVGSSGSENDSGSEFIDNVFNAKVEIGGSVTESGNVSSGDTSGVTAAGANISDSVDDSSSGDSVTSSKIEVHSASPAAPHKAPGTPAKKVVVAAPTSASEVGPFLLAFGQTVTTAATKPQADATQLAADEVQLAADQQSYTDAFAAIKAWEGATRTADYKMISADKLMIRKDHKNLAVLAADEKQLATDESTLHSDMAAAVVRFAQDKATFIAKIKGDLLQKLADTKLLKSKIGSATASKTKT